MSSRPDRPLIPRKRSVFDDFFDVEPETPSIAPLSAVTPRTVGAFDEFFGADADVSDSPTEPPRKIPTSLKPTPLMAADATRVASPRPALTRAQIGEYQTAAKLPGFSNPALPSLESIVTPELERRSRLTGRKAPSPLAADASAVARKPLAANPTIRGLTQPEIRQREMDALEQADAARVNAGMTRLLETASDALPGPIPRSFGVPAVRAAAHFTRGVGESTTLGTMGEGVDIARGGLARLRGDDPDALRSTDDLWDQLKSDGVDRAADLGGYMYGAGSLIAAQNRVLANLGRRVPDGSRLGAGLRTFDPATPVRARTAALQSAAEGLPFDLAYEADTPEQRMENVGAGLALGAGLGPLLRKTVEPKRELRELSHEDVATRVSEVLSRARRPAGAGDAPAAPITQEQATQRASTAPVGFRPLAGLRRRVAETIAPELEQERRAAQRSADLDDLTGIANVRALNRALPAAEADANTSIVVWDGDDFGKINKTLGQDAGDRAIREMAQSIYEAAEESGYGQRVFRRGGDEFVALIPKEHAETVRRRAVELFGNRVPAGDMPRVSLSGAHGQTFADADAGLRAAKAQRRAASVPTSGQVPVAGKISANVAELPVSDIKVDPARFQFKQQTDAQGVGRELKSVQRFDPNLAGIVSVWRDPADGATYVVNGHHRVELAQRTGHPSLTVRYVDAPDAATARTTGALINIAEGRGTPIDAAKLFRDGGITPAQLEERGISLRGAVARDGIALSKLHPSLFNDVVNGTLPVQRAAVIGGADLTPEQQLSLAQMIGGKEKGGRSITNETLGELIRFVKGAGETDVTQGGLFGEEVFRQSNALEKAELSAYVREQIAKDKRLFGFLTRGARAGRIEETGVGRIETEKAGGMAEAAAQAEEVYTRLSTTSGPIAQALNDAAAQLAQGANRAEIRETLYNRVRAGIEAELAAISGAGRAQSAAGGGVDIAGRIQPHEPGSTGEGPGFFDQFFGADSSVGRRPLRNLSDDEVHPGPDIDTWYTPAEIRDNIAEHKRQHAEFPIDAAILADYAKVKKTTVEEGARRLRAEGYTISREVEVEARFLGRGADTDALEFQPDMFGGPAKVTGDAQGSLFASEARGLTDAERQARASIARLKPIVTAGRASAPQQAEYREALALLRRGEGISAEEGRLSAADSDKTTPNDTRDLFGSDALRGGDVDVDAIIPPEPHRPNPRGLRTADEIKADPFRKTLTGRLPEEGPIDLGKPRSGDLPDIKSRKRLIEEFRKVLGIPIRTGRFKGRGVLGIFKRNAEVIRSKVADDVEVISHEGGHYIHKFLFGTNPTTGTLAQTPLKPWRDELNAVGSYDGSPKENLAEFVRRYVTNPESVESIAPKFTAYFEGRLGSEWPEVLDMLKQVREDYRLWREAPAQARVRAQRARPEDTKPQLASIEDYWLRSRTAGIDNLTPLRIMAKRGNITEADIAKDAGSLADLARGSSGVAELFIERGVVDAVTRKVVGKSLKQALDPLRNDKGIIPRETEDDFWDFAIAVRVRYLYKTRQGDIGYLGIEAKDAAQTVRDLDRPEFRQAVENITEWHRGLLRYLRDSGVITDGAYAAITKANEVYVPLLRLHDTEPRMFLGGGNLTGGSNPIKQIRGSARLFLDPGEVAVQRAHEYTRIAAKQEVANALVELSNIEGIGKFIEEIPAPVSSFKFEMTQVLQQLGFTKEQIAELEQSGAMPDALVFFGASQKELPNILSVVKDGRRHYYQVDPALYDAIHGINEEDVQPWAKLLAIPAKTLRAGATLAPDFSLKNPVRDQFAAAIQSEWGYVPFVDLARGLASILKKDEYWQAFMAGGGSRASLLGLDRKTLRRNFEQSVGVEGARRTINGPIEFLRAFSELMEDATRVGETRKALIGLRAQGVPEGEAVRRAAHAGREVSIDFARHGAHGAKLRTMAAFWNARIQGYDKLARTFKKNPERATLLATAYITVPAVTAYLLNREEPDYFEIPQWERDAYEHLKVGEAWFRMPRTHELAFVFGTVPQRILAWMDQHDPEGFERSAKEFMRDQALGLTPIPTFARPLIDNYANHSEYMGRRIVPRGLEGVAGAEQYTDATSSMARVLGKLTNYSPAKIENVAYGYTGGLGRLGAQIVDTGLRAGGARLPSKDSRPLALRAPGLRAFASSGPGSQSESIDRLYEMRDQANEVRATLRKLEREGRDKDVDKLWEKKGDLLDRQRGLSVVADRLGDLRGELKQVQSDRTLTPARRQQLIEDIQREMRELAAQEVRSPQYLARLLGGGRP